MKAGGKGIVGEGAWKLVHRAGIVGGVTNGGKNRDVGVSLTTVFEAQDEAQIGLQYTEYIGASREVNMICRKKLLKGFGAELRNGFRFGNIDESHAQIAWGVGVDAVFSPLDFIPRAPSWLSVDASVGATVGVVGRGPGTDRPYLQLRAGISASIYLVNF